MQSITQRIARAAAAGSIAVAGLTLAAHPAAAAEPTPEPAVRPAVEPAKQQAEDPDFGVSPAGFNLGTLVMDPSGAVIKPGNLQITNRGAQLGDLGALPAVELPSNLVKLGR